MPGVSIEFMPADDSWPTAEEPDGVRSLVQVYRCPTGHVSDIVWTAPEMMLACETNELRFYCKSCDVSRAASEAEASCLLAAFGLTPALRIYSS